MLELENVSKRAKYRPVLNNVNMKLEVDVILGVAGAAGSGKSALLKLMSGMVKPDSGAVRYNGVDIDKSKGYRLKVGYVSDRLYGDMTILEHLRFCAASRGVERIRCHQHITQLLEMAKIEHNTAAQTLCRDLDRALAKTVGLLAAVVDEPEIILFDAPFAYLSEPQLELMLEMLYQLHTPENSIVLTSRSIGELDKICTELAILRDGYLMVQGTKNVILRRIGAQRRLYLKASGADGRLIMSLRENPYVGAIEQKGGGYSFVFEGDEDAQGVLLKELIRAGYNISEFRQEASALEQEYISFAEGLQW